MSILRIDWFRSDTMWLIEKLSLYLTSMEKAIAEGRTNDRERIARIEINSADDFDDQREELHLHELLFEKDFPSKLRYSFLVTSYILFESRSKALCAELNHRKIIEGKRLELKGDEGLPQSVRRFFESEPNKVTFIKTSVWTELSDLNALRNCIVHGSGDVENWGKRGRVMQIIHKNETRGLSLNEDGFLQIEADYCRQVVEVIRQFFHTVFEMLGFGPAD